MNSRRCIAGNAPDALNPNVSDYAIKVQAVECPSWVKTGNTRSEHMFSAVHPTTDIAKILRHVRFVPILLQKSFWGGERKFLEPLMRFTRGDVRDHIVSTKIDHGPP
jgi:hypothetical protein